MAKQLLGCWKRFRSTTVRPLTDHPLMIHRNIGRGVIRRLFPNHASGRHIAARLEMGFLRSNSSPYQQCFRSFQSASEYNTVADESLETLQDALDDWLEDNLDASLAEVVLASGVLTLKLPPHGTWVINKQSATQQIWWSSPLSGPKRFEYSDGAWWSTKDGLNMNSQLAQELQHFFPNAAPLALPEI